MLGSVCCTPNYGKELGYTIDGEMSYCTDRSSNTVSTKNPLKLLAHVLMGLDPTAIHDYIW